MILELSTPVAHDAEHDVDVIITGLPENRHFVARNYLSLGFTEAEARQLVEELNDWLRPS